MPRNITKTARLLLELVCTISISVLPISYCNASDQTTSETAIEDATESVTTSDTAIGATTESEAVPNAEDNAETDIETDSSLQADEETTYSDIITEEYFFGDLPVVFTATRLEQSVSETPVSMTIINQEMIKSSGALEIAELMRLVPGMQVANYGGDEYFVTYHGRADLYSRSLQVLVDGRSIYDPVIGGVSWSNLPLAMEDIERIEVIRGSNAAAFGSNSFSGVINIISKDPSQQQGTLVKTTIGNKQTRQVLARHAGKTGDLDYRLTVNYDEKDGLKTRYDDATNKWISFRGDYQYNTNNKLSFQTGLSKGTQQRDSLETPRDTDNSSSFQQIKWTHTVDKDSEYSLHFFHNYKELDDTFIHTELLASGLIGGFSYESDRYELEFQHKVKPASDLRIAWGAGIRHDSTVSPDTLDQDSDAIRNQVHTFVNTEWKPRDDLTVNLGAMLEKYEGFSGMFSPRVALNYALKENHIFRISHSTAYRMPNVWEEQIDLSFKPIGGGPPIPLHKTVGVPKPEKINSIELGYMAAFKDIPLTMDIKLFREQISPVINSGWDDSNHAVNFNNDGEVNINGVELQLDYQPTSSTNIHAVYSRLSASGWQVKEYDDTGQPHEYLDVSKMVPTETFGILASHRFNNGIQLSSGFYHTGRTAWLDPGDETDSYNKWDLRLGKTFKLPDATMDVSAIIHNVTDDDYSEYSNLNQAQRELYLQIGIKF